MPSAEPSKEPSKATEIVIKDKEALTSADKKTAYVFYDVKDQYGESMRNSVSINWSSSAGGNVKANKATGEIQIKRGDDKAFDYASQLFVIGVDTKDALSIQAQLTIGMERAVDTIDFDGFACKSDKSKKVDELPADFAKNEWVLLYTTKDQNGNKIDAVANNVAAGNLTFVATSALVTDFQLVDAGEIYTIDGVDYNAVTIEPGMFVDKGGEGNILAMSNKTGMRNEKVFTIGAGSVLNSVQLSAPKDAVAEHDSDVKIPYEAKDVNGNAVTSYETIVRSSNKLQLTSTRGTLIVKEENDGTAGFYWRDENVFANTWDGGWLNTNAAYYTTTGAWDERTDYTSLMAMVVGGENSDMLMLELNDVRRPAKIKSISANSLDSDAFAVDGRGKIDIAAPDDDGHEGIVYLDQYGTEMAKKQTAAFFKATAPGGSTSFNSSYYGVKVDVNTGNTLGISDDIILTGATMTLDGSNNFTTGASGIFNITATGTEKKTNSVNFTIASIKTSDYAGTTGDNARAWDDESVSKMNKSYVTAPLTSNAIKNIELADLGTVGVTSAYTNDANGTNIVASPGLTASCGALAVTHGTNAKKIKVTGTLDGNLVSIPTTYYVVSSDTVTASNVDWKDE